MGALWDSSNRLMDPHLMEAARAGNINDLLKPSFGKKLNPEGLSPLHLALQNKHSETVRRLVKFDSELIRVKGREGLTPLHFVAKTDDQVDLLSEFLHVYPSSINDVTIHEETALHIAMKSSSHEAVEVLLGWLRKNYKGEIVKSLVKEIYTDINAKNLQQLTALDIAKTLPDGTEIETTLRHARALKRSSVVGDLGEFLKSPHQWFQALIGRIIHARREMSMDMRNMILVVAVLIATATFQALLQPPGGVMRNNNTPSPPSNTTHIYINGTITTVNFISTNITHIYINGTITTVNFISTNITHFNDTIFANNTNTDTTGNPAEIMLTKSMTYESFFFNFFTLNTICFLASITAMIFVLPMQLSSFMLHIPLLFLIVSYGIAFYSISPNPSYANGFFFASCIAFPCAYSVWITISIITIFPKIRQYRFVPHKLWNRLQMLRDLYKECVDTSPKTPIQQS
ncbi:Ankyrin repeat-containing protein BDA1 [Camellia lanceoleosa]|uniref:Ankyrin repeat-containing protein BDA1 n=1 Tax=Camellia lanceoleosa TaxID=1840588 RepID=A0ACC0FMR5_9ERIC|nr:Ankyrin repeat-containing protein BDA1 [Camellia lanceoleosa]